MELFSISFLFYFLPLFLAVYYVTPERDKVFVTIIGSVLFFLFQDGTMVWHLALLLLLTGLTYLVGTELRKPRRGWLLGISLAVLMGILTFYKWYQHGALLPIGLSFYLFQMAAYLIDTYRGRLKRQGGLDSYAAQILLFPKLLSGPLMEPIQLQDQMDKPKVNQIRFRGGLQELVLGLSMKVLLADRLSALWNQAAVIGFESISSVFAWLALAAFALRLYFNFHGYSMMAIGLGKMMGFCIPRNFNDPYAAASVTDFFHRWHISLGDWFRRYLYFPLGGNRRGRLRMAANILCVWLFTGLWHGLRPNYLIWAGFLALLIINEKLWLGKLLRRWRVAAHVYTLTAILMSWVPFAVGDLERMLTFLWRLVSNEGAVEWGYLLRYLPLLSAGIFFATPIPRLVFEEIRDHFLCDCILFALFWLSVYFISTTAQDPFLYFQF